MIIISKFGLKIKNIEASTLYEVNKGIRNCYDSTEAMFCNSLFKDFMMKHGMQSHKGKSTRDIICLKFTYGTRSYKEELKHLYKLSQTAKAEYRKIKYLHNAKTQQAIQKRQKLAKLYLQVQENEELYEKLSTDYIRNEYYVKGADITYIDKNSRGIIKKQETIHYKMLYRSVGKAKKSYCMFVREELYDIALEYLRMGIKLEPDNAKLVEIGAHAPLTASTIVDKIQICPEHILVVDDKVSKFITNVVSVELDDNKHCIAKRQSNYELKNEMFDGQALIDHSIFPEWANGYILLREHFCKMAAFDTEIQLFFKDYFKEDYETAEIKDMWGNPHKVKDIKLITTNNAMKWLKLGVTYETWCDRVRIDNDNYFGIVKTAHESRMGKLQRMSYQMINSLDVNTMDGVMEQTKKYIATLKNNNTEFFRFLQRNANFSNDYEVLLALIDHNHEFVFSSYFKERKKNILKNYISVIRSGKLLQFAENLVIVGSPYAMLLHAVGEDAEKDPTFSQEEGTIQCYTERFEERQHLAGFRSPFNSRNNMSYLHNIHHPYFKRYFHLGKQIIAVNMAHTDFQDRNNGSDQDSDSMFVTDQYDIVRCAQQFYIDYPTIVNKIPQESVTYKDIPEDYARVDSSLASTQSVIGESSNLAQLCQTYAYNFNDDKYNDYVCILSVLAQCAIDNSKRKSSINLSEETRRIRNDMDIKENLYPRFWLSIKPDFSTKKINHELDCPMNRLFSIKIERQKYPEAILPMSYFFIKQPLQANKKICKDVEKLITRFSIRIGEYNHDYSKIIEEPENFEILMDDFDELVEHIRNITFSPKYIGIYSWLIDRCFQITPRMLVNKPTLKTSLNKNRSILLKILYDANPGLFLSCFTENHSFCCA